MRMKYPKIIYSLGSHIYQMVSIGEDNRQWKITTKNFTADPDPSKGIDLLAVCRK